MPDYPESFDHMLAAAPQFDLRIFQIPSGFDLRSISIGSEQPDYKSTM